MTLNNLKQILSLNNEKMKDYINGTHLNKEIIDKLDVSATGALLFDGKEISSSNSITDEQLEEIKTLVNTKADELYYDTENSKLYLKSNGEIISEGIEIVGGNGGANSSVQLINLLDYLDFTVPSTKDTECKVPLTFSFTSEHQGKGTITYKVGTNTVFNETVEQGNHTFDIGSYLTVGKSNTVTVIAKDSQGSTATLIYTIEVTQNYIVSQFEKISQQTGDFTISYTPVGTGTKTIHFIVDGVEIGTKIITSSNRIQYQNFKKLPHGAHSVQIYMTTEIPGYSEIITSNKLNFGIIAIEEGIDTPILYVDEIKNKVLQYDSISLEYVAFTPNSTYSEVLFLMDGEQVTSVNVDNTVHTWNYNIQTSGTHTISVKMGELEKNYSITVEPVEVAEATTQGLEFYFSGLNRSNDEENPAHYEYNGYNVTFNNVNWDLNGWTGKSLDLGVGSSIDIDVFPFRDDVTTTKGKTIEVDFKTKNVYDYDSNLIVCKADTKGISITPKEGQININSEDSLEVQFKDDDEIRLSFVISERNVSDPKYQLIYVYANGVISGVIKYSSMDTFNQTTPQNLHIGSNSSGIEIFNIRVYDVALSSYNILDNFIADTIDTAKKIERNKINDVFDQDNQVDFDKLPSNCPYMIIECPELPQYKGDKKKGISGRFVDKANPNKNFTFENAEIDVQGTSSAGYYIKNFKLNLKGGIIDNDGNPQSGYVINDNEHNTTVFCLKADVASSEGANNVMLMDLWEETTPYKTEPQKADPTVRQTVASRPMVLYWYNTDTGEYSFRAKYNLNWDKSNYAGFGQTKDYQNAECWEFLDNGLKLTEFRGDDFDTIVTTYEEDGVTVKETHPVWTEAFESRYPKNYEDTTNLRRVVSWIASTNTDEATGEEIISATIDGVEYTHDTPEYRLAKFKSEFEDYFHKKNALYYYIFTDIFLMVDSRAKNQFLSTYDGQKWFFMPYDGDTALGIDNVGALKFGYWLEDTDQVNSNDVYNGQKSVLWINVRKCFAKEIADLAQQVISNGKLNYEYVRDKFNNHQSAWSEAIECANTEVKYIQPYLETGNESYLDMAQGNKKAQRDYWLYHRFNYWCSKYNIGTSKNSYITLRMSEPNGNTTSVVPLDMTLHITPYSNTYINVNFGQTLKSVRGYLNQVTDVVSGLDRPSDSPVYLYNASELKSIGDLSPTYVRYCDISAATNLEELIIGNHTEGYNNESLTSLGLGNNKKLKKLDVTNCTSLTGSLALGKCSNITEIYAENTKITSVALSSGSPLRKMYLPDTITALSLNKLNYLEELSLQGYDNLTSLYVNGGILDGLIIAKKCLNLTNVYINNINVDLPNTELLDRLIKIGGKTPDGISNTSQSVLSGKVKLHCSISSAQYEKYKQTWDDLDIEATIIPSYTVTFKDWDGTVLYTEDVINGGFAYDPIVAGEIETPTRPMTIDTIYSYNGWDKLLSGTVIKDVVYTATYSESVRQYNVKWFDKGTLVQEDTVDVYSNVEFNGDYPESDLNNFFVGWDKEAKNITHNLVINSVYIVATVPEIKSSNEPYIYSENSSEPGKYTLSEIYAISHSEVYSEYFKIGDKVLIKPTNNSNIFFKLSISEFVPDADFHIKFKFDGIIDENNIFIPLKDYVATKIGEINIPVMTDYSVGDYTISDKGYTWSNNYSYKAFDGDLNTYWEYNVYNGQSDKSWYVDITHNSLYMQPKKIKAHFKDDGHWVGGITCYFKGLNEKTSEWETIGSFVVEKNVYNELDCSSNNKCYKSLRLCADSCNNDWYNCVNDIKIEGDLYSISSNNLVSILNNGTISNTFDILNINIDDTIKESISPIPYTTSTITISNVNGLYIGQDLVVKKDNEIIFTTTIDNKKNYNIRVIDEGQYSIFVCNKNGEYLYEKNINIVLGENYLVGLKPIEVVSWSEGSWGNISLMLKAHYRGELNIADYWAVGDKRIINISDVPAYNGVTTQPAQAVELTIISTSGEDVMEDGTKSAITVRCGLLSQKHQMHSTGQQSISSTYEGWKTLDMYNWLNNQFLNALDQKLQSLIKPVKVISHWYINSSYYETPVVTTYDKVFLPSISQMYTTKPTSDCNMDEGAQYEYFKTASNIIIESGKNTMMTRTTMTMSSSSRSVGYCYTRTDSTASYDSLTNQTYVAPMFCL